MPGSPVVVTMGVLDDILKGIELFRGILQIVYYSVKFIKWCWKFRVSRSSLSSDSSPVSVVFQVNP